MRNDDASTENDSLHETRKELETALGSFEFLGVSQTRNGQVMKVVQDGVMLAIKFARGASIESVDHAESIRKESTALRALGSELTHNLYRADGKQGQTQYLVTRWVEGASLSEACRPMWRYNRRSEIVKECLAASRPIRALHAAGWLHGDLQPAHCIRGEGDNYHLIDFGCAMRMGTDSSYRGAMIHFASPSVAAQMLAGAARVDYTASDEVFSFIAVTFFCLYGKPIWHYNGLQGRVGLERGLNFIVNNDHAGHILETTEDIRCADFFIVAISRAQAGECIDWEAVERLREITR